MADTAKNVARAALGQGLGMGWGDEAEAWLRERMGEGSYEQNLAKIRGEYGDFAKERPYLAGGAEFAGGALPAVGMAFIPGGQPMAARQGLGALARLSASGAAQGAVAGAGAAEDDRTSGATTGALLGGALGAALPVATRAVGSGAQWLRERLLPTENVVVRRAAGKMTEALNQSGMTPQQIEAKLVQDKSLKVPSVVANTAPGLTDLAEAVAQRTGTGARKIETTLGQQRLGAKERTQSQLQKNLNPGHYYDDLEQLNKEMKERAGPLYQQAYSYGEVTDPEVLKFLQLPQFQQGLGEAKKLLAAEGRDLDLSKPTVEVLDQVKRGVDSLIEKETDPLTGKVTNLGRVYVNKKNEFLGALDKAVPDYEVARGVYAGGAELADAMRKGLNEFNKLDHEQVLKIVSKMSDAEKDAYRTGVARNLYGKIMDPSGNFNAAQRIIGSPEMQAKLQPLFDNPGQFNLFKAALERESQLFNESNRILGGSQTGKRMQMRENLEGSEGVGEVVGQAVTGGFGSALTSLVNKVVRSSKMPEKTANKLADMLMAKDPHEVAAVVKMLEEHAAQAAPRAYKAGVREAATSGGTIGAIFPAPAGSELTPDVENTEPQIIEGPSIDEAIAAEDKKGLK